ncbi:MAG: DUF4082 domain-containing protein [Aquimonas sp.]|nr:DUF4082 domain-containing protein [Aquimonas sp.]
MKKSPLCIAGIGVVSLLASFTAAGEVINVDFNAPNSPTFQGQGAFLDRAGNSSFDAFNNYWNPVTVPVAADATQATGGLFLSDGVTPTGVTVSIAGFGPAENFPDSGIPPSQAFALMQDGFSSSATVPPVIVSGLLPNTGYLFVLYGRSANPARPIGSNFTFGSRTGGAFTSTFQSQTGSEAQPGAVVLTSRRDYTLVNARTDAFGKVFLQTFVGTLNGLQIAGEFDTQTVFTTQAPSNPLGFNDGVPYELGLRFTPSVNGLVTAIRYWQPAPRIAGITGQPQPIASAATGKLYDANGSVLGTVDFPEITVGTFSGWRQMELLSPVPLVAGETYTVSVTTSGPYVFSLGGVAETISSGALSTAGPGSGVLGPIGSLPTTSFQNSHYFRDVVFVPTN